MKLSIIIPTFNRANLLSEAIQSILSQPTSIHEIIIADDGSDDDTTSLCRQLQQVDIPVNIVVSRSEKNLGAQASRNRGILISTGDCLLFMDSDDVLTENAILPLLKELEADQSLHYVYGQVRVVDSTLQPLDTLNLVGSDFSDQPREIAGYHWHTMAAIYRKSYIQKVGFWNEELTGSQDWEFQARVKMAGGKRKFVEHIVGLWREHTGERVGTKKFRYDYVQSVIKSCVLIKDHAINLQLSNTELEARLAFKIFVHAISFPSDTYAVERTQALQTSLETAHRIPWLKTLLIFWIKSPINLDNLVMFFIQYRLARGR
jgi:glycosyltransferase involved in cell wall biosynthesis